MELTLQQRAILAQVQTADDLYLFIANVARERDMVKKLFNATVDGLKLTLTDEEKELMSRAIWTFRR